MAKYNIAKDCLDRHAQGPNADKIALYALSQDKDQLTGITCTYKELAQSSNYFAAQLKKLGLAKGERVLMRLANGPQFVIVFFGTIKAGLIPVPSPYQLTSNEFKVLVDDAKPAVITTETSIFPRAFLGQTPEFLKSIILTDARKPEADRSPPFLWLDVMNEQLDKFVIEDTDENDPAYWFYTSGTQGTRKCVIHAHRSIPAHDERVKVWQNLQKTDLVFNTSALNWSYALTAGLLDLWRHEVSSIIYQGELSPELIKKILQELNVTVFMSVPGIYRRYGRWFSERKERQLSRREKLKEALKERMLSAAAVVKKTPDEGGEISNPEPEPSPDPRSVEDDSHGFEKVRVCLSAGEKLPNVVRERFTLHTEKEIYEGLGMTEHSIYIVQPFGVTVDPNTSGFPLPGTRIAIMTKEGKELPRGETGIIASHKSCPGLLLNYRQGGEAAFVGDWFLSGDMGFMDDNGLIHFVGRGDDLITAGGFRVSPQEVEAVIAKHPSVDECVVVDREFDAQKMLLTAYVVRRPGEQTIEALRNALWDNLRENLADYKLPKAIKFVKELPKTSSGKVDRLFLSRTKMKEITIGHDGVETEEEEVGEEKDPLPESASN